MNANVAPMTDEPEQDDCVVGWMGHPRHLRRVYSAGYQAAWADERDLLDDWIAHWLKHTRREAKAHHTQDEIDEWTMNGVLAGRAEPNE